MNQSLTNAIDKVDINFLQLVKLFKCWLWNQPQEPLAQAFFHIWLKLNERTCNTWLDEATKSDPRPIH